MEKKLTVKELRESYFSYLVNDLDDWQIEELLNMSKEQLLLEFDRIKAAEEKLHETEFLLETIGWTRHEDGSRQRVYNHEHCSQFRKLVLDEKRNNDGHRKANAVPNTTIYLQDLAYMISFIYHIHFGFDTETGKINDKYSKKFNEFFEKEYKLNA